MRLSHPLAVLQSLLALKKSTAEENTHATKLTISAGIQIVMIGPMALHAASNVRNTEEESATSQLTPLSTSMNIREMKLTTATAIALFILTALPLL